MIMKYFSLILVFIVVAFIGCNIQSKETEQNTFKLTNNSPVDQKDAAVIIKRGDLPVQDQDEFVPLLISEANDTIASQTDDIDGDGQWDEVAFVYSLPANSTAEISIKWVETFPDFKKRTNVRFAKKVSDNEYEELTSEIRPKDHSKASPTVHYQMEGPGWENDVVGFRNYFDPRNGFDIFGKTTNDMVMDSEVGISGDYHTMQDWGMDVLKVNNSLGAGAVAMYKNGELHRLGDTDEARFELVTEGPVRSIFRLIYDGWKVGDENYQLTNEISIWAGNPYYQSELFLSGNNNVQVVTGIVNMESDSLIEIAENNFNVLATHAPQAYDGEYLGMALLIPQAYFVQAGETPDEGDGITQTYFARMKNQGEVSGKYYFYVGWELQNEQYKNVDFFVDQLKQAVAALDHPLTVEFSQEGI